MARTFTLSPRHLFGGANAALVRVPQVLLEVPQVLFRALGRSTADRAARAEVRAEGARLLGGHTDPLDDSDYKIGPQFTVDRGMKAGLD